MSEIITEKTDRIIKTLAKELSAKAQYVANVVSLIDEGNTIPFIARYRKEMFPTTKHPIRKWDPSSKNGCRKPTGDTSPSTWKKPYRQPGKDSVKK